MRDAFTHIGKGYRCDVTFQTTDIAAHVALSEQPHVLRAALRTGIERAVAAAQPAVTFEFGVDSGGKTS
jgi:hypothetical protein